MKLLFYIQYVDGKTKNIVKHSDYILHEGQNSEGLTAFFESPRPTQMILKRKMIKIIRRLNEVIASLETTLPYVVTTIELIDRAPSGRLGEDIYTYLGVVTTTDNCEIRCAFATFERLRDKKTLLNQIFLKIADQTSHPDEILNYGESPQSVAPGFA